MINVGRGNRFPRNHCPTHGFLLGCSASPFLLKKRGRSSSGSGITVNKKAENVEASRADIPLRADGVFTSIADGRSAGGNIKERTRPCWC